MKYAAPLEAAERKSREDLGNLTQRSNLELLDQASGAVVIEFVPPMGVKTRQDVEVVRAVHELAGARRGARVLRRHRSQGS